MSYLSVGTPAPDFNLPDQNGENHALSKYRGKTVLVYFYPKDDTPGCTKEACGIRDSFTDFEKLNVAVLGISADSVKKHAAFVKKFNLPFTLLADESKDMIKAYGAWGRKKFMGREYDGILRISYLIDSRGNVAKVYPNVKPELHAAEVLSDIKSLI